MLSRESFDNAARQIQKNNWNAIAHRWNDGRERNGLSSDRLPLIAHHLKSPILLIGAGQGQVLEKLQENYGDTTGLDWSREMLARARQRKAANLIEGDAGQLPFADESFQTAVISTGVLLPSHDEARSCAYIQEAFRVVRSGGTMIACIFYKKDSDEARRKADIIRMPADTIHCFLFWELSTISAILEKDDRRIIDTVIEKDVALIVVRKT